MSAPESPPPRNNLWYYVPVLIIALVIVVYVFISNYRKGEQVGQLTPPPAEGRRTPGEAVNQQALAKNTDLATQGKSSFAINCASCHGAEGTGNGPRATGLNPPPRNFKAEQFKFGNDIVTLHNTILKGSPGTSMPSFALLPLEETWALAHYVYSLVPNPPTITDELVASLPGGSGGGPASGGQSDTSGPGAGQASDTTAAAGDGPRIPILLAMERMTREAAAASAPAPIVDVSDPGAAIYAQRCAGCHGAQGEGMATRVIARAPDRFQRTAPLIGLNSPWVRDRNQFAALVVKGLPGRSMPGNATLSRQQIDDLYAFVRTLSTTP